MKKSEMIKILDNYFLSRDIINFNCDDLLTTIENSGGMLPVEREIKIVPSNKSISPWYMMSNEWEPENE